MFRDVRAAALIVAALLIGGSCGGGGCGGCAGLEPIPGGFPSESRTRNAVQVRMTSGALTALAEDPAALVMGVLGGPLSFNVPGSCSGTPKICCVNDVPLPTCGPINIDLARVPGDDARLVIDPVEGQRRLNVTIRARVATAMDLPVSALTANCTAELDSANGANDDLEILVPVNFEQLASGTRIVIGDIVINRLDNADIDIKGNLLCDVAGFGVQFFTGTLKNLFADQIKSAIQDQTCKACAGGTTEECGPFATACTEGTCMQGEQCLQELGLSGRVRANTLLGSLSPGTSGAFDLYEVAGGYADSNTDGLSLGLLGGMLPAGTARDRCGPAATAPAPVTISPSAFFLGNARPDTGAAFDVGIGIHVSQLAQFGFAAYDGGFLCLTLGNRTVAQLSTATFTLLSGSLGNLVENNSPVAVGLRPQSPPVITLGTNTFTADGAGNVTLTDPLMNVALTAMELDFFAAIDGQYTRVFTVVADVDLPIGLQVTAQGQLQPVLGDVASAFQNITVTNSEALTEPPAQLAAVLPSLLAAVLPSLTGALGAIDLPAFGGLELGVSSVTSVPQVLGGADRSYLAIYADLVPGVAPRAVQTTATIAEVADAPAALRLAPLRWAQSRAPAVTLALGATGAQAPLEYSVRLDGGLWSAWATNARPMVTSAALWLPGIHQVEVRARERNAPSTIDPTPVLLTFGLGDAATARAPAPFHGQASEAGCSCDAGGGPGASPLFALGFGLLLAGRGLRRRARRVLRSMQRGGLVLWVVIALLPGCSCGSDPPCGENECRPGEVEPGALGRWTSIAADDERVLVATYDQGLGDLVVVDVTDPAQPIMVAIAGVPEGTPLYDPSTYRGGIVEPGANVGAWASIAMHGGQGGVAFQDRDSEALMFARETSPGVWATTMVDQDAGEVGRYTSLTFDGQGRPAIAYLAESIEDGAGQFSTELRLARAADGNPGATWSTSVIVAGAASCAGLCAGGAACIAGATGETCAAVTADCAGPCAPGQACVVGACTDVFEAPLAETIGSGPGLYVSLVTLPDGRLAAAYYDTNARALALAVETTAGAGDFTTGVLHEGTGDRGLWASAVVDAAGTVHIAYQDAIGDQVYYTTWSGTPGTPELVDDGVRPNDRTHPVGAGAAIYLVDGAPAIAYQDGLTADVYVATRGAGGWTYAPVAPGLALDGFHIGATTFGGAPYLAWDRLDNTLTPPHTLALETP